MFAKTFTKQTQNTHTFFNFDEEIDEVNEQMETESNVSEWLPEFSESEDDSDSDESDYASENETEEVADTSSVEDDNFTCTTNGEFVDVCFADVGKNMKISDMITCALKTNYVHDYKLIYKYVTTGKSCPELDGATHKNIKSYSCSINDDCSCAIFDNILTKTNKTYTINVNGITNVMSCTCPSYVHGESGMCKHIREISIKYVAK